MWRVLKVHETGVLHRMMTRILLQWRMPTQALHTRTTRKNVRWLRNRQLPNRTGRIILEPNQAEDMINHDQAVRLRILTAIRKSKEFPMEKSDRMNRINERMKQYQERKRTGTAPTNSVLVQQHIHELEEKIKDLEAQLEEERKPLITKVLHKMKKRSS